MAEVLGKKLLSKYRDFVYSRYGIHYTNGKSEILGMKLKKLVYTRQYSLKDFYERLISGDLDAQNELLDEITVGHTFFFREKAHLSFLVHDISKKNTVRPIIWCAASSTGEEPYSIGISLLEHGLRDFIVLSSDINNSSLCAMNKGVYNVNQFQCTSDELLHKYFFRNDAYTWRVKPVLRQYLKIKRLNLHDDLNFDQGFDYIFCRNVMIYFDDEGRRNVVSNLVKNLNPGGTLFVGHTEAMITLPPGMRREAPAVFRRLQ
jgi:Methylase of chemotaxis methyl-accepting proteins